jgi:hypothetical protein
MTRLEALAITVPFFAVVVMALLLLIVTRYLNNKAAEKQKKRKQADALQTDPNLSLSHITEAEREQRKVHIEA